MKSTDNLNKTAFESPVTISEDALGVLRNTYALLSLTLGFSAIMAWISYSNNLGHPGMLITLVGFYGLLFGIHKFKNSGIGLVLTFGLTGFMGYTIGPILSSYIWAGLGSSIVTAFILTASIFIVLSTYTITTKRDFSFLSTFLMAGIVVLLGAMIVSIFTNIPGLSLAVSAGFAFFSSIMIAYQTSAIIHGGERNYVLATIGLFVSIYNLFLSLSLLHLLGASQD